MTEVKNQTKNVFKEFIINALKSPKKANEETVALSQNNAEEYGWLEPNGAFHTVPWGDHQNFALEIIKNRNWFADFITCKGDSAMCFGDYLTSARGWVLLHNPSRGKAFITRDECKRLTKAQSEFLFDYFITRGRYNEAYQFANEN